MSIGDMVTVEQNGSSFTGRLDAIGHDGRFIVTDVRAVYSDGTTRQHGRTGFIFDSKEIKKG